MELSSKHDMNILLIRPPALFFPGTIKPVVSLPVGLLSIAAVLDQARFPVTIYDAQINTKTPVSDEDGALLMGDTWEIVEKKLEEAVFDIVGISCSFSAQLPHAMKLAALIRKMMPKATIVMGGAPVSVMTAEILGENSPVDIVCLGEGEYTMLDLVHTKVEGGVTGTVEGTAMWLNGGIKIAPPRPRIQNLDDLPFPAYHLIELEDYFQLNYAGYTDRPVNFLDGFQRAVSVITSRGCPYNCVFCSIHLHMGKRWRGNSVSYVIDHISLLVNKYGVRHIHFEDDNISFSRSRFAGIVKGLEGFRVTWDTPNGVRVDMLTEELIKDCKKSGCTYLVFGVESGNQHVLDTVVDKQLDLESVVKAASWCRDAKLDTMAFYVIGFPGETRNDLFETVSFAINLMKKYDVTPHLFVATPLPGTRMEQQCLDAGLLPAPLRPLELAMMTQGNFSMAGGTFAVKDLDDAKRYFFKEYRREFIFKTFEFFIFNPMALFPLFAILFGKCNRMSFKNCLISIMHVKHSLLEPSRCQEYQQ